MNEIEINEVDKRIKDFFKLTEAFGIFRTTDEQGKCFDWLLHQGYFMAPASLKHHGAEEGGLFQHSVAVANALYYLTRKNDLHWARSESPGIIGLFHDVCKMDDYKPANLAADSWEWNKQGIYSGHGDKSVLMLAPYISLTEEEVMCIRWHMGAFDDKENWSRYTAAIHKYPNVLWTHHADMLVTHDWRL